MDRNRSDEKFPDLERPREYKDAPLQFTLVLNGRAEPVKVVEPVMDLPFPDGGRLLVDEAGNRICDVSYRFDPESDKPYRLIFKVSDFDCTEVKRSISCGQLGAC